MTPPEDLADWVRLMQTPGVGALTARQLLSAFGPPQQIFQTPHAALARATSSTVATALLSEPDGPTRDLIERTLQWAAQPGQTCLTLDDPAYPQSLLDTADPPPLLYALGNAALLDAPRRLAMVGARTPTAQGERDAHAFALAFSEAGVTIVSGFALGIDAAAHRGALEAGGRTVAVLGCGLDRIYPPEHEGLARSIAAQGALVSELPVGTPPLKQHFPRRNRLIAGLSVGTLVVEAAVGSGSLITARLAAEQGREVFAIPGSIHNPMARGCHRLIRQGAKLVETADDVFAELGALLGSLAPSAGAETPERQVDSVPALDNEYEILLDALGFGPASVDALVARTGLDAGAVASMLLILELEGRIAQQPGGLYCRRVPGK